MTALTTCAACDAPLGCDPVAAPLCEECRLALIARLASRLRGIRGVLEDLHRREPRESHDSTRVGFRVISWKGLSFSTDGAQWELRRQSSDQGIRLLATEAVDRQLSAIAESDMARLLGMLQKLPEVRIEQDCPTKEGEQRSYAAGANFVFRAYGGGYSGFFSEYTFDASGSLIDLRAYE